MNEGVVHVAALRAGSGAVVWFTGCPGSGKTTLAQTLQRLLTAACRPAVVLDGDEIRAGLSADLGFSPKDRAENVRRVAEVAVLLAGTGIVTLVALVSPSAADRQGARRRAGECNPPIPFLEVYVDAPLAVREARDRQGLYERARAQEIPNFTGLSGEYEPPADPEVHLHTDRQTVDECVGLVLARLPVLSGQQT